MPWVPQPAAVASMATAITENAPRTRRDHIRGTRASRSVSRMAVSPEQFRAALSAYATGVTVVTAVGPEGPSGATANAVTSLSLDPPMMLACLDRGSRTLASVRVQGRFGVNAL